MFIREIRSQASIVIENLSPLVVTTKFNVNLRQLFFKCFYAIRRNRSIEETDCFDGSEVLQLLDTIISDLATGNRKAFETLHSENSFDSRIRDETGIKHECLRIGKTTQISEGIVINVWAIVGKIKD